MIGWTLKGRMRGRPVFQVLALGAVVALLGGCGPAQTPVISEFADDPGPGGGEGTAPAEVPGEPATTVPPVVADAPEGGEGGQPAQPLAGSSLDPEQERLVWQAFEASLGIGVIEDRPDEDAIAYDWDGAWLAAVAYSTGLYDEAYAAFQLGEEAFGLSLVTFGQRSVACERDTVCRATIEVLEERGSLVRSAEICGTGNGVFSTVSEDGTLCVLRNAIDPDPPHVEWARVEVQEDGVWRVTESGDEELE